MRQTLRESRGVQFLLVALLLVGLIAAAPAAGQLLAGDGSDYVQSFSAAEDDYINYTVESDGADYSADGTDTIYMNVTYNGVEHLQTSQDVSSSQVNETFNVSHSELNTLPGTPGQNTTVEVNAWGENASGSIATSVSTFNVDVEFADNRSVMYFGNTSASEISIDEFEPSWFAENVPLWGEPDQPDDYTIEETRTVSGDSTDITIHMADSDLQSGFDDAADAYESSEALLGATVSVDDTLVPVFHGQRASGIVDGNDTHAVYDDGKVDIVLGSDYSNASEVDVSVASQNPIEAGDFEIEDIESAYNDELTPETLDTEFGLLTLGVDWFRAKLPFGLLAAGIVIPVALRRRSTED